MIVGVTLSLGMVVRAEGVVEWVPPAVLDDAPVRAVAPPPPERVRPEPIVVPLPAGLHTATMSLAALAVARGLRAMRRRRA